ncbi:FkbM family methyltransferase [Candidatus Methylopumilus rimovensis]|jgi:FkbM family methyltransferase|uniref:FkbM family methyltransferase n=1 Tax=Candidatus Methylopumilus rimovensis TaxID=2588535 RepID=UPI00111F759D|nr:FkbM family methyltransferase [Candidatus Methylopumilus rimovensis]QDD12078.1 FkbM family methyltransferase [Candidatus Methylopumilus rimovensis]
MKIKLQIKRLIEKYYLPYSKLRKLISYINKFKYEINDVYASYLSRSLRPVITPYGFMLVGSKSIHHIAMQKGTFEPAEVSLFEAEFKQSDVFVDVGANIGFYSCIAKTLGKHVIAIEPLPKNLNYLLENLSANHWDDVEIFPVGLSEKPGFATLYGASSTGASLIGSWAGASQRFKRRIAISTLDVLLGNRFASKKLFIKIDVEGVEYSVLQGSILTLGRHPKPTWVIEICLNEYHPNGMNPNYENIFNLFWNYGYSIHTADLRNLLITPCDVKRWVENGVCDSGTINYKFSSSQ